MRGDVLARLCLLRTLEEENAKLLLGREAAKMRQVQAVKTRQQEMVREQRLGSHKSMAAGDRSLALSYEFEAEAAAARCERLTGIEGEIERTLAALQLQYSEARKQTRQVELLHNRQSAAENAERERKEQSASDTWFLLRAVREGASLRQTNDEN